MPIWRLRVVVSHVKAYVVPSLYNCPKLALSWAADALKFWSDEALDPGNSLVLSVLLYGCESWTLVAESERRLQAFEMKCFRRMLGISYRERKTNEYVNMQVRSLAAPVKPLLTTVKRRKFQWFGHVIRSTNRNSLSKTILQGSTNGSRARGRQRRLWTDNLKVWSGKTLDQLIRLSENRNVWRSTVDGFLAPLRSSGQGTK